MARNVEIKARIPSVDALLPKAAALANEGPFEIEQDDTFFCCQSGRLKLRDFLDGSGELIFYRRADQAGPKESFYLRSATSTPAVLRESLSLACGQAGRVVKHRTLFLVGRTRIHLDRVEGLGHFLELEVVLEENEPGEVGRREARELMERLGIEPRHLVEGAYVELFDRATEVRVDGVVRGSCLCGGVRFEVRPPFVRAGHCHCSRCRKHSGTAVCTQARVPRERFTLLQGEDLIRVYGEGEGAVKAFCTVCGSSLFGGTWPHGRQVSIRMGAFDDDPGIRPQFHTYVGSRAPWDEIVDGLPQYDGPWREP